MIINAFLTRSPISSRISSFISATLWTCNNYDNVTYQQILWKLWYFCTFKWCAITSTNWSQMAPYQRDSVLLVEICLWKSPGCFPRPQPRFQKASRRRGPPPSCLQKLSENILLNLFLSGIECACCFLVLVNSGSIHISERINSIWITSRHVIVCVCLRRRR